MGHDHGVDLPAPLRPGDSAETKRHAYAALLDAAKLILGAAAYEQNADSATAARGLDAVAAMSTLSFLLSRSLGHCSWAGFYRRAPGTQETLIVGPYIGNSIGCLTIDFRRGVCGAAAREKKTQVVPDVSLFPGHIACSSATRSEIVVPVFEGGDGASGEVAAVLDLDSESPAAFDGEDAKGLEALCAWLGRAFFPAAPARGRGAEKEEVEEEEAG